MLYTTSLDALTIGSSEWSEKEETLAEKARVQFDFDPEALKRLDAIVEKMELSTRAEVIRKALKVYEWLVNEVNPRDIIHVVKSDGGDTDIFPVSLLIK